MNWENSVRVSGQVHLLKGRTEGETGTGKYVQFAVRQDNQDPDGSPRRDFLVVRVYDDALRELLNGKQAGDPWLWRGRCAPPGGAASITSAASRSFDLS